jgi:hypothetical protein
LRFSPAYQIRFGRSVFVVIHFVAFSFPFVRNYFSVSHCVYSTFYSYSQCSTPPPPPLFGAAKRNSCLRKVIGALWRHCVLICRYGDPFVITEPVFYGRALIFRKQSVIVELNEH